MSVAIQERTGKTNVREAFKSAETDVKQREHYLEADEEYRLGCRYRDNKDPEAMRQIVNAHDKLAVSMAYKFKRYKVDINDLKQEARIALMKAVDKFDPEKGVRFSTYAMWWIKANLQQTVMSDYSHVRIGTTAEQKKLFFNLRGVQNEIVKKYPDLNSHEVNLAISDKMNIPLQTVEQMQARMSGDYSLNTPMSMVEGESREWIDFLESSEGSTETTFAQQEELRVRTKFLIAAMGETLTNIEQDILTRRRLQEEPETLETLSQEYGVSRERIRQIEVGAFEKVKKRMLTQKL